MTLPDDAMMDLICSAVGAPRRIAIRMTITRPEHVEALRKVCNIMDELLNYIPEPGPMTGGEEP